MNVLTKYLEKDTVNNSNHSLESAIYEFDRISGSLEEISASIESMTLLTKVGEVSQEAFEVSLEHYGMPATVTMEGVKDGLKKAWEAIVAMFKKFWAWVTGNSKKITGRVDNNIKEVKKDMGFEKKVYIVAQAAAEKARKTNEVNGVKFSQAFSKSDENVKAFGDSVDKLKKDLEEFLEQEKPKDESEREELTQKYKAKITGVLKFFENKTLFVPDKDGAYNADSVLFTMALEDDFWETVDNYYKSLTKLYTQTYELFKKLEKEYDGREKEFFDGKYIEELKPLTGYGGIKTLLYSDLYDESVKKVRLLNRMENDLEYTLKMFETYNKKMADLPKYKAAAEKMIAAAEKWTQYLLYLEKNNKVTIPNNYVEIEPSVLDFLLSHPKVFGEVIGGFNMFNKIHVDILKGTETLRKGVEV